MERDYTIKDTPLTHWMIEQARRAGWDLDNVEVRNTIRMTAALIRTSGVGVVDVEKLSVALGVSVADIKAAAGAELAANEAALGVFEGPGMAALDEHLDTIAWPEDNGRNAP